jgi:hypothetical protein
MLYLKNYIFSPKIFRVHNYMFEIFYCELGQKQIYDYLML